VVRNTVVIVMRALVVVVLAGLSCGRVTPTGGMAVDADAAGVGGAVYVNGRIVGHLHETWWITSSPLDTVAIDHHLVLQPSSARHDSSLASGLDALVPMGRGSNILVVSKSGARLATKADLGESTQVHVSFGERRIWTESCLRAKPALPDSLDDDGDGYHDEAADTVGR